MTYRSAPHRPTAHRAPRGPHEVRRRRALIGTLLAVTLGLLALALPSAAGAITGGKPAAWLAAAPARHTSTSPPRSHRVAPPAAPLVARTPAATSPAPSSTPAAPSATTSAAVHTPVAPAPAPAPAPTPAPAAAPPVAAAPAAAPPATGDEAEVLVLVNQQRAAAGCPALTGSSALADLARAHSADMRDRGYFSHDTPEGLSPFERATAAGISTMRAENIAMGQATPTEVMAAWMASPGHRANILDCSLRTLGVGVAYGTGGPWWTQDFGS